MASSVSNLVINLAEVIHTIKCRCGDDNKTWGIKCKDCDGCLEYANIRDDLIEYKWFYCNNGHEKFFDEHLIKRFSYTYKLSNHDINKVILLLRKGDYPCEYITRTQKEFA